jgi:hypothetical protein
MLDEAPGGADRRCRDCAVRQMGRRHRRLYCRSPASLSRASLRKGTERERESVKPAAQVGAAIAAAALTEGEQAGGQRVEIQERARIDRERARRGMHFVGNHEAGFYASRMFDALHRMHSSAEFEATGHGAGRRAGVVTPTAAHPAPCGAAAGCRFLVYARYARRWIWRRRHDCAASSARAQQRCRANVPYVHTRFPLET